LLREVYQRVSIDGPLALDDAHFQHLRGIVVNWHDGPPARAHDLDAYRMPDHGLFSAGIVQDVAPFAEIHLIRALDDHGVGDLQTLIRVLRALPDQLPTKPGQRLIVNLSLMVDVPPRERLLPRWFPELSQDAGELRRRGTDVEATLTQLDRALRETISWLSDRGILVVAAAGNDALNLATRPEPRHPARFDNVLGVAAVNRRGKPSAFSNRGDERVLGNGVATFGGDARRREPGEPPRIEPADGHPDALVGIFSGEELPLGVGRNSTGWVYWSGTSFATPIITAVAANVWAAAPELSPREVIHSVIQRYASPRNRDLDCPIIAAGQEVG
jgi:subtilisin family serine protease